jgi:hypothetical protein
MLVSVYCGCCKPLNWVTRIGFDSPGGVVFNNFILREVEENPPGTFTMDPLGDISINGGFTIIFTE